MARKRTRKSQIQHTCGSCPACARDRKDAATGVAKELANFIEVQLDTDSSDWLDHDTVMRLRKLDLHKLTPKEIVAACDVSKTIEDVAADFLRAIKEYDP
jgi:hypothetical protein